MVGGECGDEREDGSGLVELKALLLLCDISSEVPEVEGECFIPVRGVAECVEIEL